MRVATLTRSFSAGEITPELFGRIDLSKFQTGLKTCRNFEVLPHGPVVNSPGFEYILETKNSAKQSVLIPFIFNTAQAYQLEFGDQYIRFHTQAGTVLEAGGAITAITQANPGVVTQNAHGYANGQVIFLSGIGGMTQLNGRFVTVAGAAANTYQLTYFDGTNINTTAYGAYTAGGTGARVYEIASPYLEADLQDLHYTQSADVMTITHPSYDKRELKRLGAVNWTLAIASMAPIAVPVNSASQLMFTVGGGGAPKLQEYLITFTLNGTLEESQSYRPRMHTTTGAVAGINSVTSAVAALFTTAAAHGFVVNQIVAVVTVVGANGWFDYFIGQVDSVPLATTFTMRRLNAAVSIDTTSIAAGGIGVAQGLAGWVTAMTNASPGVFTTNVNHGFVVGDPVCLENFTIAGFPAQPYFGIINTVPALNTFTIRDENTGVALGTTGFGVFAGTSGLARLVGVYNDLTVVGHSNSIRLMPSPLPSSTTFLRYNIYKKANGLYGFIGSSSLAGTFVDANILPDATFTPPISNDVISTANNFP